MGERAGYRCSEGEKVSPMLRKQWFIGDTKQDLEKFVRRVAEVLMSNEFGEEELVIGDGSVALRNDLGIDRLFPAIVTAIYSPPFDSIYKEMAHDISDHGIYEIEMIKWNEWLVNSYRVTIVRVDKEGNKYGIDEILEKKLNTKDMKWNQEVGDKTVLMKVRFREGETLEEGMIVSEENMPLNGTTIRVSFR